MINMRYSIALCPDSVAQLF